MKEEKKRYYLVEYCGSVQHVYNSQEELDEAFDRIRKYNKRKTPAFITGNCKVDVLPDGKLLLTSHLYNKLTEKSTISYLDNLTSGLDEKELIVKCRNRLRLIYEDKTRTHQIYYPDINIAYFADRDLEGKNDGLIRRIKYIPVLYKDAVQFMKPSYIDLCLSQHARERDLDFFSEMVKCFNFNHNVENELDNLERAIDRVKNQGYGPISLYYASADLYKGYIVEREKDGSIMRDSNGKYVQSRRRLRDFGFYVKNYHSSKEHSPIEYQYLDNKRKLEELQRIRKEIDELRKQDGTLTLSKKK